MIGITNLNWSAVRIVFNIGASKSRCSVISAFFMAYYHYHEYEVVSRVMIATNS